MSNSDNKKRCNHETEQYRIGRHVAQYNQCKRKTDHSSGYCWQHQEEHGVEK